jgi:hypothetical protein
MNGKAGESFLLDSDTLIRSANAFYTFNFAPSFWAFIKDKIISKQIIMLDKVYDEIRAGDDELSNWITGVTPLRLISHKDQDIINNYGLIMNHIQDSGFYTTEALDSWAQPATADPWLVAAAMAFNYTVITFEIFNTNLNTKQPSKKVKIPNICRHFGAACHDLYYMLRQMSFKF